MQRRIQAAAATLLLRQHRVAASVAQHAYPISAIHCATRTMSTTSTQSPSSTASSSAPNAAATPTEPLPPGPEITDLLISRYASRKARMVSLQDMLTMGKNPAFLLAGAQWLWEELPVRLAKRLRDLDDLPFGLSKTPEVANLAHLYRQSLRDALACPRPNTSADELYFTEVLKKIIVRHQQIVVDLASGINLATSGFGEEMGDNEGTPENGTQQQTKTTTATKSGGPNNSSSSGSVTAIGSEDSWGARPLNQHYILQEFLDRFNSARIGLRLLIAQHIALHDSSRRKEGYVGVLQMNMDPAQVVAQAAIDAAAVCKAQWGVAPTVEVKDQSKSSKGATGGGIKDFHYVPAHLRAMLFELLKNAMQATVEHANKKQQQISSSSGSSVSKDASAPSASSSSPASSSSLPPIVVVIVDGLADVTIKVSDRGGGIPRVDLPRVFTYTYSANRARRIQRNKIPTLAGATSVDPAAPSILAAPLSSSSSSSSSTVPPAESTTISDRALSSSPSSSNAASSSSSSPSSSSSSSSPSPSSSSSSPSWLTGSNFQPVLNVTLLDDATGDAFGLPITRLYARCLGGDLQLHSVAGHGTDAFLFLSKPSTNYKEDIET